MDDSEVGGDDAQFQTRRIDNEHYDEELLVVDGENVPSRASYMDQESDRGNNEQDRQRRVGESERPYGMNLAPPQQLVMPTPPQSDDARGLNDDDRGDDGVEDDDGHRAAAAAAAAAVANRERLQGHAEVSPLQHERDGQAGRNSEDPGDSEELEDGSEDEQGDNVPMYDAAEYNNLPVGEEVKELFKHITQFSPTNVNLQTKLRPFVPEYLPAVGDIDGFVKVERPDGKPEMLGLTVLDEPCAKQSDPTVMDLQLRRMTKEKQAKHVTVHSIPEGSKNTKAIDNWIENITDLHRHKPPPTVNYTGPMPDIESLMKEWPAEYEKSLKDLPLPSADLDCDLAAYVDIACGLLDIPVHKSRIEALHVMFSLYAEFKSSQHFQSNPSQAQSNPGQLQSNPSQAQSNPSQPQTGTTADDGGQAGS
ncbi:intraflagellar transport protein 46 homolog isoform X2 [Sycon ciliatum]|uniref:intraflagellar transport protein 46 homolog isoform X2 n=1 Tax=Sycon ciliatum TaxID=27933 RepID=UPI0020ABCB07